MSRSLLRCEAVSKNFHTPQGPLEVLRGVDMDLASGDSLAVVGPNGAGKSTLLKIIAGVTAPSGGRIVRHARTRAVIELGAGFQPELTGAENMRLGFALAGVGGREAEGLAEEVLALSGLADAIDTPVKRYSSGMLARLALSIALLTRPRLLLVDEVLAVGDSQFQREVLERVRRLRETGSALLLVTHNLALARVACDRAIWLAGDGVRMEGDADAVVAAYQDSISPLPVGEPQEHTRVTAIRIKPEIIDPRDGLTVELGLSRSRSAPPVHVYVEMVPPVGDAPWMRRSDELLAERRMNVIARTEEPLVVTEQGIVLDITAELPMVPLTPSELEVVALVVEPETGVLMDARAAHLQISGEQGRPRLSLAARLDAVRPSPLTSAG